MLYSKTVALYFRLSLLQCNYKVILTTCTYSGLGFGLRLVACKVRDRFGDLVRFKG